MLFMEKCKTSSNNPSPPVNFNQLTPVLFHLPIVNSLLTSGSLVVHILFVCIFIVVSLLREEEKNRRTAIVPLLHIPCYSFVVPLFVRNKAITLEESSLPALPCQPSSSPMLLFIISQFISEIFCCLHFHVRSQRVCVHFFLDCWPPYHTRNERFSVW